MKTNLFGRTGLKVTALGFGGAPVGYLGVEQQRITEVLTTLLDLGVNVIDTAASYPGSEEAIGTAVADRRDQFVLISKCGSPVEGAAGEPWSPQVISKTVERSLRLLRTDRLDVMLLHSCELSVLKQGDALGALLEAKAAGKVRFVGYSGDNEAAAWAAANAKIDVIQTSVNICDQHNIEAVLPIARQHNVAVMAKRPIANAAWKDAKEQQGIYVDYAATYADRLRRMAITPAELGFDAPEEEAWPRIALRFTLAQPGVHTAIIGTTNPRHIRSNIAMAQEGPLEAAAVEQLRAAFKRAEAASGQTWEGQT